LNIQKTGVESIVPEKTGGGGGIPDQKPSTSKRKNAPKDNFNFWTPEKARGAMQRGGPRPEGGSPRFVIQRKKTLKSNGLGLKAGGEHGGCRHKSQGGGVVARKGEMAQIRSRGEAADPGAKKMSLIIAGAKGPRRGEPNSSKNLGGVKVEKVDHQKGGFFQGSVKRYKRPSGLKRRDNPVQKRGVQPPFAVQLERVQMSRVQRGQIEQPCLVEGNLS